MRCGNSFSYYRRLAMALRQQAEQWRTLAREYRERNDMETAQECRGLARESAAAAAAHAKRIK